MELHLRTKILLDGCKCVAWCDEGILLISNNPKYADLLIDNRKVYFGITTATDDDELIFTYNYVEEN